MRSAARGFRNGNILDIVRTNLTCVNKKTTPHPRERAGLSGWVFATLLRRYHLKPHDHRNDNEKGLIGIEWEIYPNQGSQHNARQDVVIEQFLNLHSRITSLFQTFV